MRPCPLRILHFELALLRVLRVSWVRCAWCTTGEPLILADQMLKRSSYTELAFASRITADQLPGATHWCMQPTCV